jgi:hypothetical protein
MVYVHTKNTNGYILEGLGTENVVKCCHILWPCGIFMAIWYILLPFGIFYGHLVGIFVSVWYIFPFWYAVPRTKCPTEAFAELDFS